MQSALPTPALHHIMQTLNQADPRMLRLIRAVTFALIAMSLAAAVLPCSPKLAVVNEGLDQATLLLFLMLPAAYLTGRRQQD